ncbi:hypothetical protein ACIBPB_11980 [Micromonospora sp. NPDC049836]|uniref:hypothetical protein n=1 Tax=Micromonospora sp. NPDC049836 TaxID=3364274 RepID=UPI00379B3709
MTRRELGRGAVGVRLVWAGLLLLAPGALLRPVGPATTAALTTLRVLGARHLVQTIVTSWRPTRAVLAAGAAVDGIHAVTALALAAADPRQRHAALADSAVATCWAALGATAAAHQKGEL